MTTSAWAWVTNLLGSILSHQSNKDPGLAYQVFVLVTLEWEGALRMTQPGYVCPVCTLCQPAYPYLPELNKVHLSLQALPPPWAITLGRISYRSYVRNLTPSYGTFRWQGRKRFWSTIEDTAWSNRPPASVLSSIFAGCEFWQRSRSSASRLEDLRRRKTYREGYLFSH